MLTGWRCRGAESTAAAAREADEAPPELEGGRAEEESEEPVDDEVKSESGVQDPPMTFLLLFVFTVTLPGQLRTATAQFSVAGSVATSQSLLSCNCQ